MRLTNTLRNQFWDHALSIQDLSVCQFKIIIYIYNSTYECNRDDVCIPNIADMARAYGYDKSYFHKELQALCDYDVIERNDIFYRLGTDPAIWVLDTTSLKTTRKYNNESIHKQLKRRRSMINASQTTNQDIG